MNKAKWIVILWYGVFSFTAFAQLRVGDPGVSFDLSKMDPNYPQMEHWITAGVIGGIPFMEDLVIQDTLLDGASSADINAKIVQISNMGGGTLWLANGTYNINAQVAMKANVSIIGESRDGVQCIIDMDSSSGFYFGSSAQNCGIYRLTIMGSWGQPQYDWNIGSSVNDELPGNDNISVKFKDSQNCWLDKVSIINSARDPMRCNAQHTTFRDLIVDGCHRKSGGAQGYFFIQDGYNLVTSCQMTHLRHISLQGNGVEYNVVYDNDFLQEVSFHSGDDGNNLIENNRITLPADMPPGTSSPNPNYYAIMGPWSIQHTLSATDNFLYKNQCIEYNHDPQNPPMPWSDSTVVYAGPIEVKPADPATNFPALPDSMLPIGRTLYPIILDTLCTAPQIDKGLYFRAFLQGAMPQNISNDSSLLMRDDLRVANMLPFNEPYSAIYNYTNISTSDTMIDSAILNVSGENAIVDWVAIEFRDMTDPKQIIDVRLGLLQRDGDIVGLDGVEPITDFPKGTFFIALRHRNHLGIMTADPLYISACGAIIDFSDPDFLCYGTHPRLAHQTDKMVLWGGNTNMDEFIIFQGADADTNTPFFDVLTASTNTAVVPSYIAQGYYHSDCNMDHKTIYQGSQNDLSMIFFNVISFPENISGTINYKITEQLPK